MDSVRIAQIIQEVIDSKPRSYTKEESRKILLELGIIDENGEITPTFQGIIVMKENNND